SSSGLCGLAGLVEGAKPSYPQFESPPSAHGERNGVASNQSHCLGKCKTITDAISHSVGRLG
ncbi:MAG: hypothetical protein ACK56F_14165, partial [bacterium]